MVPAQHNRSHKMTYEFLVFGQTTFLKMLMDCGPLSSAISHARWYSPSRISFSKLLFASKARAKMSNKILIARAFLERHSSEYTGRLRAETGYECKRRRDSLLFHCVLLLLKLHDGLYDFLHFHNREETI